MPIVIVIPLGGGLSRRRRTLEFPGGLLLKTCSTGYEGFLSPVSGQEPFDVDEA